MFKNICLAGHLDWVLGSRSREAKSAPNARLSEVGSNPVWCRSSYNPHNINQYK